MKYLFTTILGSFVLDDRLTVSEEVPFNSIKDYERKSETENKLRKKYPGLKGLPAEKLSGALASLRDKKYFSPFHRQNLALTKKAIKESVSEDQLIIQTIANINELDKTGNLLVKRLREWYALYFPEIEHRVPHQEKFVELISSRSREQLMKELKVSDTMGANLEKSHVEEIILLANAVAALYKLRKQHETYLEKVMKQYCPNLLELGGTTIGAKLLELGKGLKRLALLPASTIQLLGAEKALFRHITSGSRSPKYGILYQHPLVQKAGKDQRGKMARMLADKLSLCARLDYFKGEFKAKEYRLGLEGKV